MKNDILELEERLELGGWNHTKGNEKRDNTEGSLLGGKGGKGGTGANGQNGTDGTNGNGGIVIKVKSKN